jgi:hypothetical protein
MFNICRSVLAAVTALSFLSTGADKAREGMESDMGEGNKGGIRRDETRRGEDTALAEGGSKTTGSGRGKNDEDEEDEDKEDDEDDDAEGDTVTTCHIGAGA